MSMKDPVSRPRKVALLAAFAIILSIAYLTVWSFVAATQLDQANALRVGEGIAQELADKTRVTISHTDRLTKLAQAVSQGTNTSIFSSPDLVADSSAQVILADAMGTVLESTVLRPGQTIAATQFFRDTHETWSSELYLGAPEPLTAGGPKILPMVKRLFQANGQYAGFVTVVYPAESLTNTLTLPGFPTTLFAVVNSKGDVLSRSLGDVTTVGGSLTPAERHALEGGVLKTQPLVSFPSLGRADLLTVAVPVGRQGLIAVVGIPLDEATAETKKLFWAVFPVAALICLGVAATAGLILRQTKRLHQSVASLKATETVLREDRTFLSVTLASVEEGVLTVDAEGRITYMNRRATLLTGWDSQSAGGRAFTEVVHLWPDADDSPPISRLEDLQGHSSYLLRDVDGNTYSVECAVNELSEGSDNGNRVVVLHDVSKAAQMARTLHHQATHDALTGLLNRISKCVAGQDGALPALHGPGPVQGGK
jgi:PAS domain S-box-containing protein